MRRSLIGAFQRPATDRFDNLEMNDNCAQRREEMRSPAIVTRLVQLGNEITLDLQE